MLEYTQVYRVFHYSWHALNKGWFLIKKQIEKKEYLLRGFSCKSSYFPSFSGFFSLFLLLTKDTKRESESIDERDWKNLENSEFTCAWKISELLHEKILFLLFNLLFHEKLFVNNETPYIYMQNPEKHHYHSPLPRLYNAINKEKYDKSGKFEMIISLVKYFFQKDKLLYENIYPLIKRKCYSDISVCV